MENVSFDVDSVMGFMPHLGFARRGIYLDLTPQFVSNIAKSVHLTMRVPVNPDRDDLGATVSRPLHKVPHIHSGPCSTLRGRVGFRFLPPVISQRCHCDQLLDRGAH